MIKYRYNTETKQFIEDNNNLGLVFYQKPWIEGTTEIIQPLLLEVAKQEKIKQLSNFHFTDLAVREGTVNNVIPISFTKEFRDILREQINKLDIQIQLGVVKKANANFTYFYGQGSQVITYLQLQQLFLTVMQIVDTNFITYQTNINTINSLSSVEEVENFDYKKDYVLNQNINVA